MYRATVFRGLSFPGRDIARNASWRTTQNPSTLLRINENHASAKLSLLGKEGYIHLVSTSKITSQKPNCRQNNATDVHSTVECIYLHVYPLAMRAIYALIKIIFLFFSKRIEQRTYGSTQTYLRLSVCMPGISRVLFNKNNFL